MSQPRLRVLVIDPESSGADLLSALNERGAECTTYWQDDVFVRKTSAEATRPEDRLLALARATDFDAVVAASESAVSAAEVVAEMLDLPTNDPALTFARRDKAGMMDAVARAGLPVPASHRVSGREEVAALAESMQLPVVVKPTASAGSDACLIAQAWQEVSDHVARTLSGVSILGVGHTALAVQEYIDGPQYFVNTVSMSGRHLVTEVYSCSFREVDGAPHLVSGRSFERDDDRVRDVVEYTLRCLDALSVRHGAGHTEVRVGASGPVLIEFNGRLMGPTQPVHFFQEAQGYSQATVYATALTEGFDAAERLVEQGRTPVTLAYHLLTAPREGRFLRYEMDALAGLLSFRRLHNRATPGSVVTLANRVTTADLGIVFLAHPDEDVVEADLSSLAAAELDGRIVTME